MAGRGHCRAARCDARDCVAARRAGRAEAGNASGRRCAAGSARIRPVARVAAIARTDRRLAQGRREGRRLSAHGRLGRAHGSRRIGRARFRRGRARRAGSRTHRRESQRSGSADPACAGGRGRAAARGIHDTRNRGRCRSASVSTTAANTGPRWSSARTARSRPCAGRPVSTCAAGTTASARWSRICSRNGRTMKPPGSDFSTPGRLRCCRSRTAACRSSGRRCPRWRRSSWPATRRSSRRA